MHHWAFFFETFDIPYRTAMKKAFFLLTLLLAMNGAFSQDVKVNYTINEECGVATSIDFHLDESALTGKKVIGWTSYGNSIVQARPGDTITHLQTCELRPSFFIRIKFDQGPDTSIRIGFLGPVCPDFFSPQIGFLDSASQQAKVEFVFNDSSLAEHSLQKAFLSTTWITDVRGIERSLLMDTMSIFALAKKLGSSKPQKLMPGQYEVQYKLKTLYNSQPCTISQKRYFHIGHQSRISLQKQTAVLRVDTLTDSSRFTNDYGIVDEVFYWDKRGRAYCSAINWWENSTCIDTNILISVPDSNRARSTWKNSFPNYQSPAISEDIHYDYNSDGIIDFKSSQVSQKIKSNYLWRNEPFSPYPIRPYNVLPETLKDSVKATIWSRDSIGQWIKSEVTIDVCNGFERDDTLIYNYSERKFTIEKQKGQLLNIKLYTYTIVGPDTLLKIYKNIGLYGHENKYEVDLDTMAAFIVETISNDQRCDKIRRYVLSSPVGIDKIDLSKKVRISPRMSSTAVRIKAGDNIELKGWTILDLSGKVLLQKTLRNGSISNVGITSLTQGTYILHIETDKGVLNERITRM